MKRIHRAFGLLPILLSVSPAGAVDSPYRLALPGYHYQFPRDHFEHEDFRTEWWYYTGNVTDARGERFGFELVFFRQGTRETLGGAAKSPSAWSVDDVYLAHSAVTDAHGKRFFYDERLNRRGPGLAGASFEQQRIWNGNWSARWSGQNQTLDSVTDKFRFHLELEPEKPFVIQGENGVSQKSDAKGRASYYVSFPRLRVKGSIQVGTVAHQVQGLAWMDHEWFTSQLTPGQIGWNWFSVQLHNGTELMLLELRRNDGVQDSHSSGTFTDKTGKAVHLRRQDFTLQPLATWNGYPVEWRITVPSLGIDLKCKAVLQNQELRTKSGGPSYWEGAVDYSGTQKGVGYLEMTGYHGRGASVKTLRKVLPFLGIAIAIALLYDGWIFYSRWSAVRATEREKAEQETVMAQKTLKMLGGTALKINSFYGSPAILRKGEAADICYGVVGAAKVRLEPPVEEVWPALNHCLQVHPARNTEYKLIAEDQNGHSVSESFTLQVHP